MSRFLIALMLLATAIVVAGQSSSIENTPKCPPNEIWSTCGRLCEPSCRNMSKLLVCPRINCRSFMSGCRCQQGYLRKNNVCVKREQCFA